jgi:hypothetical protein
LKALLLGIIASLFFASTFVLNRAMELSGGSWVWSAALRYLFMLPPLLAIVLARGKLMDLLADMRRRPRSWIVWSTVGFGLFYAPICFAAAFGPAWLVASTWQITIIAGALLTPWIGPRRLRTADRPAIPLQSILISGIMLLGVLVVQLHQAGRVSSRELWLGVAPVAVAAVAYPLGNRKMMALVGDQLDTFQRVLGMTIASLPFWLIVAAYGLAERVADAPIADRRALLGRDRDRAVLQGHRSRQGRSASSGGGRSNAGRRSGVRAGRRDGAAAYGPAVAERVDRHGARGARHDPAQLRLARPAG